VLGGALGIAEALHIGEVVGEGYEESILYGFLSKIATQILNEGLGNVHIFFPLEISGWWDKDPHSISLTLNLWSWRNPLRIFGNSGLGR
jgi:hypothetical protein